MTIATHFSRQNELKWNHLLDFIVQISICNSALVYCVPCCCNLPSPAMIPTPWWPVAKNILLWCKGQVVACWNTKLVCSFQVLTSSSQATSQQLHQSCLFHCWRGFSGAQVGWCSSHSKKRPSGGLVWKRGPAAPKNLRAPRTSLSEVRLHRDWNPSHFNPVYSDQWPSFPPHQLLLSAFPNPSTISHTFAVSWA